MRLELGDTIAALASPPGPGARAVVRLSGADCRTVAERVFRPRNTAAWHAALRPRRHPGLASVADGTITLPVDVWLWPGTRSYTGEPAAEFHLPGSPPLAEALLEELCRKGARPARAGEFTLRAFLAGRIDLLQAEAVLGVIDATDDVQLSSALSQLAGGLSGRIAALHQSLLSDLADLEAGLDFVDEDIAFVHRDQLRARLTAAATTLEQLLQQASDRLEARSQARMILAGLPNAGKSTLFNALAGRDAALVSAERGTTRDWLRVETEWDGCRVELVDTAGWDAGPDRLAAAVQRAGAEALQTADLVVWCTAADATGPERALSEQRCTVCAPSNTPVICVTTKADLVLAATGFNTLSPAGEGAAAEATRSAHEGRSEDLLVSAHSGAGLQELRTAIIRRLDWRGQHVGELLGSTAARCRGSLRGAWQAIGRAAALVDAAAGDELIAIELRTALEQTGQVAGQVTTDDLLDRIFSRFCIGK